jgi:AcrR family transcriptional regulator
MSPAARKRASTRPAAAAAGKSERRGRGRPAAHDSDLTRDAILAAALHRFGRAGYDSVAMESIAADCGVNVRAIYYHFASKRLLFVAVADEAFRRYGREVVERVFVHAGTRERIAGYVDVHRALRASDPDVLPFIGMWLVDQRGNGVIGGDGDAGEGSADHEPSAARTAIGEFLGVVVDDAIARGEVSAELDRDGALLLLSVIGMGLALGALADSDAYPAMLDALDLLNAGTLFTDVPKRRRRGGVRPRQ